MLTGRILKIIHKLSIMIPNQTLPDEDETVIKGGSMTLWTAKWQAESLWDHPIGLDEESAQQDSDEFMVLSPTSLIQHNLDKSVIDIDVLS